MSVKFRRQKRCYKEPRHCTRCNRPLSDFRQILQHQKCGAAAFLVLDSSRFAALETIDMKTKDHPVEGSQFFWSCCEPNPAGLTISGHEPGTVLGSDGQPATH